MITQKSFKAFFMKYWVNINKSSKCYLHADSCSKVPSEAATMKDEKAGGGWYSFDSKEKATEFLEKKFPDKSLFADYCIEEHE
jgi:hypothetical protein